MERGGGGSIVNISSVASTRALDEHIAYCTSKSAVDSITRVMALELGKHKVPLINSVELIPIQLRHQYIDQYMKTAHCQLQYMYNKTMVPLKDCDVCQI